MPFDSTRNQWYNAAAIPDLTMTVGTASDTIPDVGAAYNQATLNNIVRSLGVKVNALLAGARSAGMVDPD